MNPDQRKALIDAMLALGTVARAMPLGELYEAIERDEKAERTRDGRWTQSLIHSVRWLTDVSGELERVRVESRSVPYVMTSSDLRLCKAVDGVGLPHVHYCQRECVTGTTDHLGEHTCACGHTWVTRPTLCSALRSDGSDHIHLCVRASGHHRGAAEPDHSCSCGGGWGEPCGDVNPVPKGPDHSCICIETHDNRLAGLTHHCMCGNGWGDCVETRDFSSAPGERKHTHTCLGTHGTYRRAELHTCECGLTWIETDDRSTVLHPGRNADVPDDWFVHSAD